MRKSIIIGLLLVIVLVSGLLVGWSQKVTKSVVPIPPDVASLPTVKAEPWLKVDEANDVTLEGPAFDVEGNLFVTEVGQGHVVKITPEKDIEIIYDSDGVILVDGIAIHENGRLFIACVSGELLTMEPDGSDVIEITPDIGTMPASMNDLVFRSDGNLYVTDFTGTVGNPTGGVHRFSSISYPYDTVIAEPVYEGLAAGNGVSLSPNEDMLWVGETSRNAIVKILLMPDGITIFPIVGVQYPFYSTGPEGPDSNCVDVEGNVYQALMGQGRVLILNAEGIPIANVIVRGRDEGKHLKTANVAFKPGTSEVYLCASGEGGAWIYKFDGLAEGLTLYSHQ